MSRCAGLALSALRAAPALRAPALDPNAAPPAGPGAGRGQCRWPAGCQRLQPLPGAVRGAAARFLAARQKQASTTGSPADRKRCHLPAASHPSSSTAARHIAGGQGLTSGTNTGALDPSAAAPGWSGGAAAAHLTQPRAKDAGYQACLPEPLAVPPAPAAQEQAAAAVCPTPTAAGPGGPGANNGKQSWPAGSQTQQPLAGAAAGAAARWAAPTRGRRFRRPSGAARAVALSPPALRPPLAALQASSSWLNPLALQARQGAVGQGRHRGPNQARLMPRVAAPGCSGGGRRRALHASQRLPTSLNIKGTA